MLRTETLYHIYNRANGSENLFREDRNYHYFLQQWTKYIEPIADTYAYCLMPNHFHFLIKTKSESEITSALSLSNLSSDQQANALSKRFSNLFNAYAKAYNKAYKRKGSLFMRPFKAKEIDTDSYFTAIVRYIHQNPVRHGFCKKCDDWMYSSYGTYLSDTLSRVKKEKILNWFGGLNGFLEAHTSTEDSNNDQIEY